MKKSLFLFSLLSLTTSELSIGSASLLAQEKLIEQTEIIAQATPIPITDIKLNQGKSGLEIILETPSKEKLQPLISAQDNTLIIDILEAELTLPKGGEFQVKNPTDDITEVTVTQVDKTSIRITVIAKKGVPIAQVVPSEQNLVLSLNTTQTAKAEEEIEVVATQEKQKDSYFVPKASTATGTDTPILDIPQSIQVVPEQVIQDRNVTELGNALETVPGVVQSGGRGLSVNGPGLLIRGFDSNTSIFRDGIPYFSLAPINTSDIQSIEVLKGPASVLFGAGEPGGVINLISKQPLAEPFYSASFTVGNFNTYQGELDISGPLNEQKTVKYRLNIFYGNYGSFREFVNGDQLLISSTVTWDIGPNTSINFYGQYLNTEETIDGGIPAIGNGIANIPRERFLGESFGKFEQEQFNLGYKLNHKFNEDWSIRHALDYIQYQPLRFAPLFDSFDEETGELARIEYAANGTYQRFFTNIEVTGKFKTGSFEHQLLLGVEYRYLAENPAFQFSQPYSPINIYNPIYSGRTYAIAPEFFRDDDVNRVAVYVQDQVDLSPNLKVLLGIRYDSANQFRTTRNLGEPREEFYQQDTALSPRFGIVYQPIPTVSIYGSYSTSFNPSFGTSRNPDDSSFEPETGQQLEVGIKADLTQQLSLTFSAFDIKKQNISVPDPNNQFFSIQTGEQTSRGIEMYLAGEILPGWNLTAGYTYLDAFVSQDTSDIVGNLLSNVPDNQFSLWTTYRIQEGDFQRLGFGLGLFYVSQRAGDLDNTFVLPSYFRTDAAIFYKRDNWQVQLNIENLFDINYFTSATFGSRLNVDPGAPFTVSGKFSIQF